MSFGFQGGERIRDAWVKVVFKYSFGGEALSIQTNGALDEISIGGSEQSRKTLVKRRPNVAREVRFGGRNLAEFTQSILKAAHDPVTRIGERAVEVEEDGTALVGVVEAH